MKKFFAIVAFCLLTATAVNAQDYNMAVGVEGGWEGVGLTFKQFTSSGNFMDYKAHFLLGEGFGALASATFDFNQILTPGLSFFYGVGVEAGFYAGSYKDYDVSGLMFGGFGNLGVEYAFSALPFAISLDWNPGIRIGLWDKLRSSFSGKALCMGIKYTF